MAATTQKNTILNPDWQAASERAIEAGERLVEVSRKTTGAYLDGVEKYITSITGFERKLSQQSQFAPFAGLLHAQADLTEDITTASLSAARELIAA
jgi:hypothetical protein